MPKADNIRRDGFQAHYLKWCERHPDAVPYEQLMHFIQHGDQFGRKVPAHVLARLARTSRNTMQTIWLPIIKEELSR